MKAETDVEVSLRRLLAQCALLNRVALARRDERAAKASAKASAKPSAKAPAPEAAGVECFLFGRRATFV